MNDLKTLTGRPQPLSVDGETYMVHPLDMGDWGALQAWLDARFGDPFDIVNAAIKKGGYTPAQQQYMLDKALEKAMKPRCPLGSVEADALLMSMDGYTQILHLSIRKGRPDFTLAEAAELAMKLTTADAAKVGHASTLNMVASDPKDEPPSVRPPSKKSGSAASRPRTPPRRTGG